MLKLQKRGWQKVSYGRDTIKEYMKEFKEKRIKDIILGCTHYPIYDEIIKEELGYDVNLINTGKCVAEYFFLFFALFYFCYL